MFNISIHEAYKLSDVELSLMTEYIALDRELNGKGKGICPMMR